MLPPTAMLAIKNQNEDGLWKLEDRIRSAIEERHSVISTLWPGLWLALFFAFAVLLSGCTPAGPRALLKGKASLDRGDYPDAVAELKTATSLLATNAQAWNYLGLAYQCAAQPAQAADAYQHALMLDRDLVEAHYNLGCLWLDQNKPEAAVTEFTAFTLRRSNVPEGWIKRGWAQLRAHQLADAEKSFGYALYLSSNNAEALNGLGLAQIQQGRPREAAQYFGEAIKTHPDYAPALLNLATVTHTFLHDNRTALQYYQAYLALTPRPANWNEVNELANSLEQPVAAAAVGPPPQAAPSQNQAPSAPPAYVSEARVPPPVVHVAPPPKPQPPVRAYSNIPPAYPAEPAQVVQVQPQPVLAQPHPPATPSVASSSEPVVTGRAPVPDGKPSAWHRLNPASWFHSSAPEKKYVSNGVTPLPSASDVAENPAVSSAEVAAAQAAPAEPQSKPANAAPAAPPGFPRYSYASPHKPKAGDRLAAAGAFTRAREFEQDTRWLDALRAYQQAAEFDPGWFEAQYNFGVLAYRLQNYPQALAAYELALAIQPNSVDARYNFALALQAARYVPDAVIQLNNILAANPNDVRAHLALGNLYAQQLHDFPRAREHYLKVLALDPHNAETTDIQFWLSSHPQ
jgi:tetratricopeptide (TPR) repeat protein